MELSYSRFILRPKQDLNHFSRLAHREGVFFKYDSYYAEYTPWLEFGDLSVDHYLNHIRLTKKIPDLILKKFDLDKDKKNIRHDRFFNHGLNNLSQKTCKLKINDFISKLKDSDLEEYSGSLRLDCNNFYTLEEFLQFYNSLSKKLISKIEYFEDPCPYNDLNWGQLRDLSIPLAIDRNSFDDEHFDFEIYKPSIDFKPLTTKPVIYSSYMGSDLDRYHTYLELMSHGDLSLFHGVDTPNLFLDQSDLFQYQGSDCFLNTQSVDVLYGKLKGMMWTKI